MGYKSGKYLEIAVIGMLTVLTILAGSVVAKTGKLELIGVPEQTQAGRYESKTGIFYADVTAIDGAIIQLSYEDMVITGRIIEWHTKDQYLLAEKEVKVVTDDSTVLAERLEYHEEQDKADFTGGVVVEITDGRFQGEKFVMYMETEEMEFFGPFQGEFSGDEEI